MFVSGERLERMPWQRVSMTHYPFELRPTIEYLSYYSISKIIKKTEALKPATRSVIPLPRHPNLRVDA